MSLFKKTIINNSKSITSQIAPEKAYVKSKFRESRDENGILTYLSHTEGLNLIGEKEVIDIETGKTLKIKDIVI